MENFVEYEAGHVIEDIIYDTLELCDNGVVLVEQLIEVIAMALEVSEDALIRELEKIDSLFTANNPIQGFILENGVYKPYRRLTIYASVKKSLSKSLSNFLPNERVQILEQITATHKIQPLKFKEI